MVRLPPRRSDLRRAIPSPMYARDVYASARHAVVEFSRRCACAATPSFMSPAADAADTRLLRRGVRRRLPPPPRQHDVVDAAYACRATLPQPQFSTPPRLQPVAVDLCRRYAAASKTAAPPTSAPSGAAADAMFDAAA